MTAFEQEPEIKHGTGPTKDGTTFTHPAFGQITVSKTQGGNVNLYGSDFRHNHYVTVRIQRSQLNRDLARDWAFGKEELIEIAMSEAQWAQFVSSFGSGGGTQVTIQRFEGKLVPRIPHRDSGKLYQQEAQTALNEAIKGMNEAIAAVEATAVGLSKAKQEAILGHMRGARKQLDDSMPFIAKQFDKHVEDRIEKAKVEVHAWAMSEIVRLGMEKLVEGKELPLSLEGPNADHDH